MHIQLKEPNIKFHVGGGGERKDDKQNQDVGKGKGVVKDDKPEAPWHTRTQTHTFVHQSPKPTLPGGYRGLLSENCVGNDYGDESSSELRNCPVPALPTPNHSKHFGRQCTPEVCSASQEGLQFFLRQKKKSVLQSVWHGTKWSCWLKNYNTEEKHGEIRHI